MLALSIARWMLSLGIEAARALLTARRRRGFMSGSGMPDFAATVSSRESLEKAADRFLSCAPLRCMMFLNLEWPAICVAYPGCKGMRRLTTHTRVRATARGSNKL